jgi:hypothetical protein
MFKILLIFTKLKLLIAHHKVVIHYLIKLKDLQIDKDNQIYR